MSDSSLHTDNADVALIIAALRIAEKAGAIQNSGVGVESRVKNGLEQYLRAYKAMKTAYISRPEAIDIKAILAEFDAK